MGGVKLQYVAMKEQIADVLMKPLARVKFEYFREKLGVLQRGFLQGKGMSPIAILMRRSDIRAEPLYHGERIGSFLDRYEY